MGRKIYLTEAQFKELVRRSIIKENNDEGAIINEILNSALLALENKEYSTSIYDSEFDGSYYVGEIEIYFGKINDTIGFKVNFSCDIDTKFDYSPGDNDTPEYSKIINKINGFDIDVETYIDDINVQTSSDCKIELNIKELNPKLYNKIYDVCASCVKDKMSGLEYPEGYFTKDYWKDY
jgi:hypothetical protein